MKIYRIMTEQLFNALKAIETLVSGTTKVYVLRQSINLHSALS